MIYRQFLHIITKYCTILSVFISVYLFTADLTSIQTLNSKARHFLSGFATVARDYNVFSAVSSSDMANKLVEIDGSVLEGGGQILRNAFAFSVLTGTPIKIVNIRANRDKPGLMEQHLKGLQLMQEICHGDLHGAEKGSTTVQLTPGAIQGGSYKTIVKTAGSIALLLQVSLPAIIFANDKIHLTLEGGTNAEMAPQIDYMTEVFRPNLERMGTSFDFHLIRRGYFPKGGGRVEISVDPVETLQPIVMEDMGEINTFYGWSFVAGKIPIEEANEIAEGARKALKGFSNVKVEIETYQEAKDVAPIGDCAGIILVAETSTGCVLGGSALKKRTDIPMDVGKKAAEELLEPLRRHVCVDDHSQDQLIVFMALAKGTSRIKVGNVTMHTKTAIHVAELLTEAKFKIENFSEYSIIECEGIGYRNKR